MTYNLSCLFSQTVAGLFHAVLKAKIESTFHKLSIHAGENHPSLSSCFAHLHKLPLNLPHSFFYCSSLFNFFHISLTFYSSYYYLIISSLQLLRLLILRSSLNLYFNKEKEFKQLLKMLMKPLRLKSKCHL